MNTTYALDSFGYDLANLQQQLVKLQVCAKFFNSGSIDLKKAFAVGETVFGQSSKNRTNSLIFLHAVFYQED